MAASPCLVSFCRCCWPRSTACICAAASFLSVFSLATTLRVCVRSVPLDSPLGMRGDRAGWASGVRVLHCSPGSEGGLRIQGCGNCCVDCCCGCVGVDLSPPLAFELAVPQTPSFSQWAQPRVVGPCGRRMSRLIPGCWRLILRLDGRCTMISGAWQREWVLCACVGVCACVRVCA